jgi:hypothetical protein
MEGRRSLAVVISLKLAWGILVCFLLALTACGSDTASPASDPPGALVRLQRNSGATTLPGDLTVFSNGGLQLYLDDRGALRKTVAPAEGEVRIFPRNDRDEEVAVGYRIEDGTIPVDPWPFGVESHTGYLVGYQLEGYPTVLEPIMLHYQLVRVDS